VGDNHVYVELIATIHSIITAGLLQTTIFFYWITGKYQIITFEEYILIALYADRIVGIYPEIKNPVFINQHVSSSCMTNSKENLLTLGI
jgi:hypothetical protein